METWSGVDVYSSYRNIEALLARYYQKKREGEKEKKKNEGPKRCEEEVEGAGGQG